MALTKNDIKEITSINESNLSVIFDKVVSKFQESFKSDPLVKGSRLTINPLLDQPYSRIHKGTLFLELPKTKDKFFPLQFCWEVLTCWIPDSEMVRTSEEIKAFNIHVIAGLLKEYQLTSEWKNKALNSLSESTLIKSQSERIEKFLQLDDLLTPESPLVYYFRVLRKGADPYLESGLYDSLFHVWCQQLESSFTDELAETIKNIFNLFLKVKSYKSITEYKDFFKQMKNNGELNTEQSLRQFTEMMKQIDQSTSIAPTYRIHWNSIGATSDPLLYVFNPHVPLRHLNLLFNTLPFILVPRISFSTFSKTMCCFHLMPAEYQEGFEQFYSHLIEHGLFRQVWMGKSHRRSNLLNLNYFRSFYSQGKIIDIEHKEFKSDYLLFHDTGEERVNSPEISLLEMLVLDRIRYYSVTGFPFERRSETIKKLQSDLNFYLLREVRKITSLMKLINNLLEEDAVKSELLRYLERHGKHGFQYCETLARNILELLKYSRKQVLSRQPILAINAFLHELEQLKAEMILPDQDWVFDLEVLNTMKHLPVSTVDADILEKMRKNFRRILKFMVACKEAKMIDIKSIIDMVNDPKPVLDALTQRWDALKKKRGALKKIISSTTIDTIIDGLLERKPPAISPQLLNTITVANITPIQLIIILKKDKPTLEKIERMQGYFSRVIGASLEVSISLTGESNEMLYIESYVPPLSGRELRVLASIFLEQFQSSILLLKYFEYSGFLLPQDLKDEYDLETQHFHYMPTLTIDLEQFFKTRMGKIRESRFDRYLAFNLIEQVGRFYEKNLTFKDLMTTINSRVSKIKNSFDSTDMLALSNFHHSLNEELLKALKEGEEANLMRQPFFKKHVRSISFIPNLGAFNLDLTYTYILPKDATSIMFDALFLNTFKGIKYSFDLEAPKGLVLKQVFPQFQPNKRYINYLRKNKQVLEYCTFRIKNLIQLFQFDYNISSLGWAYDDKEFAKHVSKVLSGASSIQMPVKSFSLEEKSETLLDIPNDSNFKVLSKLYRYHSERLYTQPDKWHTRGFTEAEIDQVAELIRKGLILPYLKLKNVGLQKRIYFLIPNITLSQADKIIDIFKYFNVGLLYKIEGNYYIEGDKERSFEHGLYIKLWLPESDFSGFQDKIFQALVALRVEHLLIFYYLSEGRPLMEHVFGSLDFMEKYYPLSNLIWSQASQCWINHKIFGENLERRPIDLLNEGKEPFS